MIGIFDSGAGGYAFLRELRRLTKNADVILFCDKRNAPYGTKNEDELKLLVSRDIKILTSHGASAVLMACCTASTVYEGLTKAERKISTPIIFPTSKAAVLKSRSGKIGIIATERTTLSGAFPKSIKALSKSATATSFCAQELVNMIENGVTDQTINAENREKIKNVLSAALSSDIDTLILGCTHFPHLKKTISSLFSGVEIIDSAREGARSFLGSEALYGEGKTVLIEE